MSFATVTESDVIKDVFVVEPTSFGDSRGRFVESYRRSWFPHGREMVQGNRSDKMAGTVVGVTVCDGFGWRCFVACPTAGAVGAPSVGSDDPVGADPRTG